MSSLTAEPRLRSLGAGETLGAAIKLYRNHATSAWKAVAVVIVPLAVIQIVVRRLALPSDVFVYHGSLYTNGASGSAGTGGIIALLVVSFLGLLAQLLAAGALFKLLLDAYLGKAADWRQSLAFARHRVGALLWLGILMTVLLVIAFVLIVFPGVWLLTASSVAVPALMLEGVAGFKAIRRSIQLVSGRWWATFGRLLVAVLLYLLLLFVIGFITRLLSRGISITNVTLYEVVVVTLSTIVVITAAPFISAVLTVIYIDLRVRKEALDLELVASGFATPGSTVPPPGPVPTPRPSSPPAE